ncbi:MAG: hypothetical protein M1823_004202 [Watsoniomyces obsoletus]|nr:MAG: hypothetical protein M1823_004202 [Watsoniomyces obsoletus]
MNGYEDDSMTAVGSLEKMANGSIKHPNGQVLGSDCYFPGRRDLDEAKDAVVLKRKRLIGARLRLYGKRKELISKREKYIRTLTESTPKLRLHMVHWVAHSGQMLQLMENLHHTKGSVQELEQEYDSGKMLQLMENLQQAKDSMQELEQEYDSGKMLQLMENLQQAKDSMQELENEYDSWEDQLQGVEMDFEKAVRRFMDLFFTIPQEQAKRIEAAPARLVEVTHSLPSISSYSSEDGVQLPPVLHDYYTRLGDANLLKERMADMLLDYLDRLRENGVEKINEQHSHASPDAWLDHFKKEWSKCLDELEAAEVDIRKHGREARRQGLLLTFKSSAGSEEGETDAWVLSQMTQLSLQIQDDHAGSRFDPSLDVPLSIRRRVNDWFIKGMMASGWEVAFYRAATDDNSALEPEPYMELVRRSDQEEQSDPGTVLESEAAFMSSNDPGSSIPRIGMITREKSFSGHHRAFSC